MLIGIVVGYQLQKNFRGRDVIFTLLMMPMMLSPDRGRLPVALHVQLRMGHHQFPASRRSVGTKLDWLGQTNTALWAVVIADAWMWTPFIDPAGHRRLPRHSANIYEAAEIDGAVPAFRFFRITLPMSAPILFIALLLRLIDAFKQYDLFFALTGGGPGNRAPMTVSFQLGKDRLQLLLHRRGLRAGGDHARSSSSACR